MKSKAPSGFLSFTLAMVTSSKVTGRPLQQWKILNEPDVIKQLGIDSTIKIRWQGSDRVVPVEIKRDHLNIGKLPGDACYDLTAL